MELDRVLDRPLCRETNPPHKIEMIDDDPNKSSQRITDNKDVSQNFVFSSTLTHDKCDVKMDPTVSITRSSETFIHTAGEIEPNSSADLMAAFQSRVDCFIKKHSDMYDRLLFDYDEKEYERLLLSDHDQGPPVEITTDKYCVPDPPIESYMEVSNFVRKERFFKLIKPGDIIKGVVLFSSVSRGLTVHVLSIGEETAKLRDVLDLKIKGVIKPVNVSADKGERDKVTDDLYADDIVKAVIVDIDNEEEILNLSFRRDHLNKDASSTVILGYLQDEYMPSMSTKRFSLKTDGYVNSLQSSSGFNNPTCVDNLKEVLKIPLGIRNTFLEHILLKKIVDVEYYDGLKYMQRKNWSMKLTKSAVKFFKRGRLELANAYLNYGLDIDSINVEGLVARGALNANRGEFDKSIHDFQRALNLSDNHRNAKCYLVETYIAYGEKLEAEHELKEALECYKNALSMDPSSKQAKIKTETLSAILVRKAAENEEIKRKKHEEEHRLKKLKKIVRKEKRRQRENEMHGPKEKPNKSDKKKRKKNKRKRRRSSSSHSKSRKRKRHHESSDEYDASDSQSAQSSSPSFDRSTYKVTKRSKL